MTKNEEVDVDDLLADQAKQVGLATIEAVPDNADLVRVTPWVPGRGCACHFALVVPKQDIGRLVLTEHRHHCCGKALRVVEVEFKEKGVLPIAGVFADLSRRAAVPSTRLSTARPRRLKSQPRPRSFFRRYSIWQDPFDVPGAGWDDGGVGEDDGWDNGEVAGGAEDCITNCMQSCLRAFEQYGKINPEQRQFCRELCSDQCGAGPT